MNMDAIYVKTAKGANALTDKYVNLPFALKRALIIVDGIHNVGELHDKASQYNDLEESLETLFAEGFIQVTSRPGIVQDNTPTTTSIPDTKPDIQNDAKRVKWRLISLIQVDIGSKSDNKIKATSDKMIHDLSEMSENYEDLSKTWKKCIKIIKLTIDEQIAEQVGRSGEKLLAQLKS